MLASIFALIVSVPVFASGGHDAPVSATGGWEALSTLQTGNMRYYEGHPRHPHTDIPRREEVASGQKPHSIVVTCSDSRVPPEQIFDQGLGDIFVIRNAGNVMSSESIASIEYAVAHLGSKLLVVMGHESCGAVGAAISHVPGQSAGSPALDALVKQIRNGLSAAAIQSAGSDKTIRHGVKENVNASLADLLKKSAIVRDAVASKGLVLGQAIYSLKSGRVEFWDVGKTAGEPIAVPERVVIHEPEVKEEVIKADPKPAKAMKKGPRPASKKVVIPKTVVSKHDGHSPEAAAHSAPAHGSGSHDSSHH